MRRQRWKHPMMSNEKLLTPTDVAIRLQVKKHTVTGWLRNGFLRGYKVRKEWRVLAKDIDTFVSQQVAGKPH